MFLLGSTLSADEGWIRLQSPNFDIYSTATPAATRESLQRFEELRACFTQALDATSALDRDRRRGVPVRIVTFGKPDEYEPYAPWKIAAAHYQPGPAHDTIVMSRAAAGSVSTAAHEYFHLVAYRAGLKVPAWLSEGLAELHSTARCEGNTLTVGDIIPVRLQRVRGQAFVPLSIIVAASRESAFFAENAKATLFYDEAWALTHMLSLSDAYAPKWLEFLKAIQTSSDSIGAFTKTYRKSMDTVERDLKEYVRGDRFATRAHPVPPRPIDATATQTRPAGFDVKLLLVDLNRRRTPVDQTRRRLLALAAESPKRPEPYAQLGYLAWQTTGPIEAAQWFDKAYAAGERSPELLWDYGRLAARRRPERAARVFQDLLAREPARQDARIELAAAQVATNRPNDAINTLGAGPWPADTTPRVLSIVAAAELKRNRRGAAKNAVERLLASAATGEYHELALRLLKTLH